MFSTTYRVFIQLTDGVTVLNPSHFLCSIDHRSQLLKEQKEIQFLGQTVRDLNHSLGCVTLGKLATSLVLETSLCNGDEATPT